MSGLSMGDAITLYTAFKYTLDLTLIAPIAAPLFLTQNLLWFLPVVHFFYIKYFPNPVKVLTINEDLWTNQIFLENNQRYDKFAIPTVVSLLGFSKELKNHYLAKITLPILTAHGKQDSYVHSSNATYIYEHVSSSQKELIWLENSDHVATIVLDKELLFEEITKFFQAHL